jgi:hypothetical protein
VSHGGRALGGKGELAGQLHGEQNSPGSGGGSGGGVRRSAWRRPGRRQFFDDGRRLRCAPIAVWTDERCEKRMNLETHWSKDRSHRKGVPMATTAVNSARRAAPHRSGWTGGLWGWCGDALGF